ncbi:hypothetical protein CF319_g9025, partial [Tilletia indica]
IDTNEAALRLHHFIARPCSAISKQSRNPMSGTMSSPQRWLGKVVGLAGPGAGQETTHKGAEQHKTGSGLDTRRALLSRKHWINSFHDLMGAGIRHDDHFCGRHSRQAPPLLTPRYLFSNSTASPAGLLVIGEKPIERGRHLRLPQHCSGPQDRMGSLRLRFHLELCRHHSRWYRPERGDTLVSIGFSKGSPTPSGPSSRNLPSIISSLSPLISCPVTVVSSLSWTSSAVARSRCSASRSTSTVLRILAGTSDTLKSEMYPSSSCSPAFKGFPTPVCAAAHGLCKGDSKHPDTIAIQNLFWSFLAISILGSSSPSSLSGVPETKKFDVDEAGRRELTALAKVLEFPAKMTLRWSNI